jgi:hypothetical protein
MDPRASAIGSDRGSRALRPVPVPGLSDGSRPDSPTIKYSGPRSGACGERLSPYQDKGVSLASLR